MNIFPFTLFYPDVDLFREYVKANRDLLNQTYGRFVLVGGSPKKQWSYYEADIEVLDATTVVFHTYRMLSMVHDGRGPKQEEIKVTYPAEELAPLIETHKYELARQEYLRRETARKRREEDLEIRRIMAELSGEPMESTQPSCSVCRWNVDSQCENSNWKDGKPILEPTNPQCGRLTKTSRTPIGFSPMSTKPT